MAHEKALKEKIVALRETVAWMDLVLASINQGILVVDKNWRIVFANTYLAEAIGENRILLLGQPFSSVLPGITDKQLTSKTKMNLRSIHRLNGLITMSVEQTNREMSFEARYVESLQQAVCIITDVSSELKSEEAAMRFFKEIGTLRQELIRVKQHKP